MLGPSAVLILHRVARYLSQTETITFDTVDLAASIGLGTTDRTSGQFNRTMQRLEMFGMIRCAASTVQVRTIVPPLPQRHINRLPATLRAACPWGAK